MGVVFALNDYGQVGVFYKGVNAPASGDLIWHEVDVNGNHQAWKEEVAPGLWLPIGNVDVLDVLNSFRTDAAASANTVRLLKALIDANKLIIDDHENEFGNYQLLSDRNQPGGYVGIDAITEKIDPAFIELDGLIPVDIWLANSGNPPTVAPNEKEYWIVTVAGNYNLGGISVWQVGDRALFLRGVWNRIPATTTNDYNALDQVNAGFQLDARQGKVLKDLIDGLDQEINDNYSAINALSGLVAALQVANTALTNALAAKQDKIIRLTGTINAELFYHNDLIGVQKGQLEIHVGGMRVQEPTWYIKNTPDDFLTVLDADNGSIINVTIYPL